MTMKSGVVEAAQLAMFESAWFGQGPAFWRWVETTEAESYIAAFIEQHKKPEPGERFDLIGGFDDEPADILDRTDFSQLAAEIEAQYGEAEALAKAHGGAGRRINPSAVSDPQPNRHTEKGAPAGDKDHDRLTRAKPG